MARHKSESLSQRLFAQMAYHKYKALSQRLFAQMAYHKYKALSQRLFAQMAYHKRSSPLKKKLHIFQFQIDIWRLWKLQEICLYFKFLSTIQFIVLFFCFWFIYFK